MAITLHIQLISKPEMTVQEAQDYIARYFPGIGAQRFEISATPDEGVVHLSLNQDELTEGQRDWLHTDVFAARYVDDHMVEKTIKVRGIAFEVKRISKIKVFAGTGDTLYFRVRNDEDNPDDYNVVPGEEGYEAMRDLFLDWTMKIYNDSGESPSTGYCQIVRMGIEKDLKLLGYQVQQNGDEWEAVAEKEN